MILYNLDDLKPGMVIAKPVHNTQGVFLLKEGAALTEKNIWVLKSWGITEVWVEGESEEEELEYLEQVNDAKESIGKELNEKFSEVMEDDVMVEVRRVAGNLLLKRSLKGITQ